MPASELAIQTLDTVLDLAEEHLALWEGAEKRAAEKAAEAEALRRRLAVIPGRALKVARRLQDLGLISEGHEKAASGLAGDGSLAVIEFLLDNFVQPPPAAGGRAHGVAPLTKSAFDYTDAELRGMSEEDFTRIMTQRMRERRS